MTLETSDTPRERRFQLINEADLDNLPYPDWLISGILVRGTAAMIWGKYASAKSFVALDLALCVQTGIEWHGHKVTKGQVVYISGEGLFGQKARIKAWRQEHGIAGKTGIQLLKSAAQLHRDNDVTLLINEVRDQLAGQPLDHLVIDTLSRSIVGADEDRSKEMSVVVENLDRIKREFGCTILVVHHTGWSDDHGRGSTALPGGIDTEIQVTRSPTDLLTLKCKKQKDGAKEFPDLAFQLKIVTIVGEFDREGNPITSCVIASTGQNERLDDEEQWAYNKLIAIGWNRQTPLMEWKAALGWGKGENSKLDRIYRKLIERGYIRKVNIGRGVLFEIVLSGSKSSSTEQASLGLEDQFPASSTERAAIDEEDAA